MHQDSSAGLVERTISYGSSMFKGREFRAGLDVPDLRVHVRAATHEQFRVPGHVEVPDGAVVDLIRADAGPVLGQP